MHAVLSRRSFLAAAGSVAWAARRKPRPTVPYPSASLYPSATLFPGG